MPTDTGEDAYNKNASKGNNIKKVNIRKETTSITDNNDTFVNKKDASESNDSIIGKEKLTNDNNVIIKKENNNTNIIKKKSIETNCFSQVGRTSSDQYFKIPKTYGFFEYFWQGKLNITDAIAGGSLALGIAMLWSRVIPRMVFLLIYLFWRVAYNVGIGYILKRQSQDEWFTNLIKNRIIGNNAVWNKLLKPAIRAKLGFNYDFEGMPVEYNAWLIFRMLVDLILFNDFNFYILFAMAYNETTFTVWTDWLRILVGSLIVLFNWWVKSDAHRVVKDYAWYWGDFFFLFDGGLLTFDGVFELAPHPMYSLGYVGYYGMALMCSSYTIFFVSLAAHVLQLAFLVIVETPHMDKIYGNDNELSKKKNAINSCTTKQGRQPMFHRDMILFFRFDPKKATDMMTMLFVFSMICIHATGIFPVWFVIGEFLVCRGVFCGVVGYVLSQEDREQAWTRHYIKWGYTLTDAFNNWKAIYNFVLLLNYTMFIIAAAYTYKSTGSWSFGANLLRHTLGLLMIALQVWTSMSIYEVLGEFGWFYGDFFTNSSSSSSLSRDKDKRELVYAGIYRYLNNPEKIVGQAAYWGLALISWDWKMVLLAAIALFTNYAFLEWVERPHMERIYGDGIRRESGVAKTVKKVVPGAGKVALMSAKLEEVIGEKMREFKDSVLSDGTAKELVGNVKELLLSKPKLSKGKNPNSTDTIATTFKTVKESFEIGESIQFQFNEELKGDERVAIIWERKIMMQIPISDCKASITKEMKKSLRLFTIDPMQIPWKVGKFKLAIFSTVHEKDFPITPYFNMTFTGNRENIEKCLTTLLSLSRIDLDEAVRAGGKNPIFKRLSEMIMSVYGVELAPITVFQFSSSTATLAEQINFARNTFDPVR